MPEYVPYLSSNLLSITVHLLLPRGFTANLILLIWYFCGGVCLWAFEGNILALMFKPVYEDPVDTAQDIIDRGLIPVITPTAAYYWKSFFTYSDNELYRKLARIIVVQKDDYDLANIIKYHVQGNGTHVILLSSISEKMKTWGRYHLSQEIIEGTNPYKGWITNKLFYLNEDLAKHILIYQQVC